MKCYACLEQYPASQQKSGIAASLVGPCCREKESKDAPKKQAPKKSQK